MPRTGAPTPRDCVRALWLLGLVGPVSREEVTSAWRGRVARTHPDRFATSAAKVEAAEVLTRALNDARTTLVAWIDSGREWPQPGGPREVRFDEPEPWPERREPTGPAPVCRHTGLRAGDHVRLWPYDGELLEVTGTEVDGPEQPVWVLLRDAPAGRAELVRLAAFSCPVCGLCAGPDVEDATIRPCPDCLVDLRRLEQRAGEGVRIRRAIEARAEAGIAVAQTLHDGRLLDRARERRRWARRLRDVGPDDLHAALLGAFGRAWERWGSPVA